jgi:hypothetical protein
MSSMNRSKSVPRRGRSHSRTERKVDPLLTERSKPPVMPIKGRIRPTVEIHYVDLATASYNADTTGTVTALNLIAEGNDNTTRLGRKALMRDVQIRGFASAPANNAADITQQARIVLVWDNAASGALPAITDVLTAINNSAFINVNNVARFSVLHDRCYSLGPNFVAATTSVADQTIKPVDINVRLRAPTEFSGTAAAITSVQNGALLMLTMGSAANSASSAAVQVSTRVTFSDVL